MTVAEMIQKLQEYPQDLEIKITDGFKYRFYGGEFGVQLFEDADGTQIVDISIGGCEEEDQE